MAAWFDLHRDKGTSKGVTVKKGGREGRLGACGAASPALTSPSIPLPNHAHTPWPRTLVNVPALWACMRGGVTRA